MIDNPYILIGAAAALLQGATSNSLDPEVRQQWNITRDLFLAEIEKVIDDNEDTPTTEEE